MARPPTLADHLKHPTEPWRLDLISRHLASVQRFAVALQRRFPGHDVEPAAMQALYLAAMTYTPGRQGFHRWVRLKLMGATANFRRTNRQREGIVFERCEPRIAEIRGGIRERW